MARIFRALLIAAVNAIQEFFAFATDNGESQVGDSVKLNDGMATSNYDWSAYPSDTTTTGTYTQTGTIEKVKQIGNDFAYGMQEPEQDNKDVTINTGEIYYGWTDGTNTYYTDTDSIRDSDIIILKNASIKGTLNNNNGVYSGFSDSNYLTCKNFLNNTKDSFEVKSKIYLTGTSSSNCSIIDTSQENSTSAFRFEINSSMKLQCRLSNTIGSFSYFATLASTTTLQLNTWYFVKVTYNSSTGYALYLTQDESNWHDPEATTSDTSMINHTQPTLFIGDNFSTNSSFPGYIDLTKTSITINGNVIINLGETITLYKTIIYDENFEPLNPQPTIEANTFVQPILTASGTMGGDSFAVSAQYLGAYYDWYPFASNANTNQAYTWAKSGNSGNYDIYNPTAFKIQSIEITNRNEGSPRSINGGTVKGSNDYSTWTDITTFTNSTLGQNQTWTLEVNSPIAYKYYRLSVTSNDSSYVGIGKIKINATSEILIDGNIVTSTSSIVKDITSDIEIIDNTTIQTVTITSDQTATIETSANITTSNNDNVVSGTDWHIFNLTTPQNMTTHIQSGGIEFTPLNMPLLLKNNTGVGLLLKNGNNAQYRNHWIINRDYDLHYQELQFSTNISDPTILVDINNINTDSPYYLYSGDAYKYKISKEDYCDYEGSGTATYTSVDGKITTVEAELVASNGTVDVTDYKYTLNNTGNMVLTKYIGSSTDVTVPNI